MTYCEICSIIVSEDNIQLGYEMTAKQQIRYLTNQWYEYYAKTVKTNYYKQYVTEHNIAEKKRIQDDIAKDGDIRNDLYDVCEICKFTICDVLDNDGVGKLIRKIYALLKSKFKFECRFRKPTLFQKFDFVHLQYNSTQYGILANVIWLNDEFVDRIEILFSQINNYHCLIEYIFHFKNKMSESILDNFILKTVPLLTSSDYRPFYRIDKSDKLYNFQTLLSCENETIFLVFQPIILMQTLCL